MNIARYNDRKTKIYLKDGYVFEGLASHNPRDYMMSEFGIDEECLQICDYLIRASEIAKVELIESAPSIRGTEEDLRMQFALRRSFSEHLKRWEDNEVPDKYDHNCFVYSAQPSKEEFENALKLQRERGNRFIKLEGDFSLTDDFGLSLNVTLTMQLFESTDDWRVNEEVEIRMPRFNDVRDIEVRHFGPLYGYDFSARNAAEAYEYLDYRGAYIGDRLVGAYYTFSSNGHTCLDGLIVDEEYRNKHIATTLLKHAVNEAKGNVFFLHADKDDTPRKMYEKMGFREVDRLYEYLSTDIDPLIDQRK